MTNTSGLTAVGYKLLVKPKKLEEKTEGGIIVHVGSQKEREEMAQTQGVVVSIGNLCWKDQADPSPWCNVGDTIIFEKYAGQWRVGEDGEDYRLIRDIDVNGLLDKKEDK